MMDVLQPLGLMKQILKEVLAVCMSFRDGPSILRFTSYWKLLKYNFVDGTDRFQLVNATCFYYSSVKSLRCESSRKEDSMGYHQLACRWQHWSWI